MKPHPPNRFTPGPAAVLATLLLGSGASTAAPFLYTAPDLLLVVRQTGNASDLIVNLGQVTRFTAVAPGTSLPITALTPAQLTAAFPNLNDLSWSVTAANRPPVDPTYPLQTIWATAPRLDAGTAAPAWLRKGQFVQGNAASQIDALGVNAALTSSLLPGGPNNTATAVVLPVSAAYPIAPVLGPDGNFAGTFQGRVESVTPSDFDSQPGIVSRADFIELAPGSSAAGTLNQPGRFLGYFEFKPDGSLTFVSPTSAPPPPTITGITRQGDTTTVSFDTVPGVQYRLRRTDASGLTTPITSWSLQATTTGTGSVASFQDASSNSIHFYAIEALP